MALSHLPPVQDLEVRRKMDSRIRALLQNTQRIRLQPSSPGRTRKRLLGLVVEPFGPGAVAVTETPAMLGELDAAALVRDIADDLVRAAG